ncbi:ribonuclease H-like domain-containing protein, partial [Tanacetum coccineum]
MRFHHHHPPPATQQQTPTQQSTPHTVSTIKLPILKKGEYDIWAMKMEHYLGSYRLSNLGDSEEVVIEKEKRKLGPPLLRAIPEDHLAKFIKMTDAKENGNASTLDLLEMECNNCHKKGICKECRTKEDTRRRYGCNPGNKEMEKGLKRDKSPRAMVTIDVECVDWIAHTEEDENFAFMASNNSGSNTQRALIDASVEIKASTSRLCLAKAQKEKDDLEVIVDKWNHSSKNLGKIINDHMPASDKFGLGTEPSELVSEPVVNESNVGVQPKVWSDAPIIEEENVKSQFTHSQKPKVNNKELRHGSTERGCFVCGSFGHLIRDCDYQCKLAKQVELHKQNMTKGNGTGVRKPTWNNVQRVNKQNQFVPLAVQTRTGINPVNTVKASGTNNVSTARRKIAKQTVLSSTALKVNTVKPIVNDVRPSNVFHKTHSPSSRPFKRTTVLKTNFSKQKVYTVKREYSNARTPQQNGVAERKNMTLIEAARTMLADSFLPNTFWAEAVSTALPNISKHDRGPREEEQVFLDDLAKLQRQEKEASEEAEALRKNLEQETENLVTQVSVAKSSSTNIFSTVSTTAKASGTNFVNTVRMPVSTASANEGQSLSETTNSQEDDNEIPPLEDIHEDATDGIFTHSSYDDEGAVAD